MAKIISGGSLWGMQDIEQSTIDNVEFDVIFPKVHVYKNLLPQSKEFTEILKTSIEDTTSSYHFNGWSDWFKYGKTIGWPRFNPLYPNLVDPIIKEKEESIVDEIDQAFAIATQHYMKHYDVSRGEDWKTMGPSICMYDSEMDQIGSDTLSMHYHRDYDYIRADEPGDKFAITCTMYLNDDYEGGALSFVLGDLNKANEFYPEPLITYKPKAGEIVVFPAGHPDVMPEDQTYFHGVTKTKKSEGKTSNKFFIRSYYMIPFAGTEEWLANQEKYGEEVWSAMEDERIRARVKTHEELHKLKTHRDDSGKECGLL
jgi:hypothetical protein